MSTLSKYFSPTTIVDGGITTLSFTIVVNDMSGFSPIVFTDTLPSGVMATGSFFAPPPFDTLGVVIVTPTTISVAKPGVPNGTYILTFEITNVPSQTNPSCEFNPISFTNQSSNLILFPPTFTFDGVPSCLVVTTPILRKKKRRRILGLCPDTLVMNFKGVASKVAYCGWQTYDLISVVKNDNGETGIYRKQKI